MTKSHSICESVSKFAALRRQTYCCHDTVSMPYTHSLCWFNL